MCASQTELVVSAYAQTTLLWRTVCLMACFCSLTPALPSRRPPAQTRAKPPSGRAARGSAKPVCKTEPGVENPAGEQPVDSGLQWFSMWASNSQIKPCRSTEATCSLLFCIVYSIENLQRHLILLIWGGCDYGFSVLLIWVVPPFYFQ